MTQDTLQEPGVDLEAFFEVDDYMYFYSDSLTGERSDDEVASLVKLLELASPMKILDLACGFGRHSNRLATLGHSVTGVDLMPGFLEIAQKHAAELGVKVSYRQGDMRQIDFAEEFDRAIMLFTTFGYFEDDENVHVMENMARALKPGGLLGFDVPNRDVTLKVLSPSAVTEKEGNWMINRNSFDLLTGRWHHRRTIIRDGVRRDKFLSMRLYNATEIRGLLRRVGLEVHGMYGDWDGQALSAQSRAIVVSGRKPV